jgi:hypothetical protein
MRSMGDISEIYEIYEIYGRVSREIYEIYEIYGHDVREIHEISPGRTSSSSGPPRRIGRIGHGGPCG